MSNKPIVTTTMHVYGFMEIDSTLFLHAEKEMIEKIIDRECKNVALAMKKDFMATYGRFFN